MKNIFKILILSTVAIITFGSFGSVVFAQPVPLNVVFNPNPLFEKPNFLPEDVTSGEVTVTNNSDATQNILTEAINIFDNDNFGNLLHLTIVGNSGTLFDNTLSNFFSTAGEVSLGTLSSGESKTFTYTISFINSSDNTYQGKTLGFDVCVGFEGGNSRCGNTIIGDEGGGTGGDNGGGGTVITGTGGGGGGGGSGFPAFDPLIISGESASGNSATELGTMLITWNTNKLSTSQVVYGPMPGPYNLDLNAVNFGYPFATVEDPTKVMNHSMTLTGLVPGQTYLYRVVSRASPATISFEHQFTVPVFALGTQINEQNNLFLQQQGADETSGVNTFSAGGIVDNLDGTGNTTSSSTGTSSEDTSDNSNQFATAFFGAGFLSWQFGLFFLLILLLILLVIWRRRK